MRDRNARHRTDDSILDAIKRTLARKAGASAHEIRGLMYTHPDRDRARALLQHLVRTGEAIKATKGTHSAGRPQERYYASPEHAAAWGQIQPASRARKTTKAMQAQRQSLKAERAVQKPMRAYDKLDASAPVICNVQPVVIPHGIDHRHTFTGTPGRWVNSAECRPWAAAVRG